MVIVPVVKDMTQQVSVCPARARSRENCRPPSRNGWSIPHARSRRGALDHAGPIEQDAPPSRDNRFRTVMSILPLPPPISARTRMPVEVIHVEHGLRLPVVPAGHGVVEDLGLIFRFSAR